MQASDHYFTTQISIFLLLNNLTDRFSSVLGNVLFRMSLRLHTSEKTVGMFNWRNYILGEISLLHYIPHPDPHTQVTGLLSSRLHLFIDLTISRCAM